MTALVLYDSRYGNTERIAEVVAAAIGEQVGARAVRVGEVDASQVEGCSLLLVGSPTHGGRPSADMQAFLKSLAGRDLRGVPVAAFDTRMDRGSVNFGLRLLMRVIGNAAPRILASLRRAGGVPVGEPQGFLVAGREGPLLPGEEERAAAWAATLPRGRGQQPSE